MPNPSTPPIHGGKDASSADAPNAGQKSSLPPQEGGVNLLTCYPPSQTETWLACPQRWDYGKRWSALGSWEPNALIGTALGAALDVHRSVTLEGTVGLFSAIVSRAHEVLETGWVEQDNHQIESSKAIVEKVLKKAIKVDCLHGGTVVGVQVPLGPQNPKWVHGFEGTNQTPAHSVADLIVRLPGQSGILIHDDKFNMRCYPNYFQARLAEAEVLWQLWQYAWLWNTYHSKGGWEVAVIQKMLMVYEPSIQVDTYQVTVTPARMNLWVQSAKKVWAQMN